jgi:hypothetical protein
MLEQLDPRSRVWVYGANRPLTPTEQEHILPILQRFAREWVSHNLQLRAGADILYDRFIVLAVDETQAGASGCSIDKSVHFLKALQADLGVDLFDRMRFSYRNTDGEVTTLPREEFAAAYAAGRIDDQTLVFDPLVTTLGALREQFEKPLQESWHARMV